jgi:hypothetical protein
MRIQTTVRSDDIKLHLVIIGIVMKRKSEH